VALGEELTITRLRDNEHAFSLARSHTLRRPRYRAPSSSAEGSRSSAGSCSSSHSRRMCALGARAAPAAELVLRRHDELWAQMCACFAQVARCAVSR
jgi:hypothetical protein